MYKYESCYIFQRCVVVSISFTVLWNFKCSDFNQFDVPVKRNYICINRIIWFTQKHFSFRNICLVCRENKKNLKLSLSLISILCCSCTPSYHGWWPTGRTSEQCSVHRSITVALLVQYCVCYWKCSCVVFVLKKRVSTDINIVDLHNHRHHFQHLLCFCRPIHCHSVSFPLSGHGKQEKMLHSGNFGVVIVIMSSFLEVVGDKRGRHK